MKLAKRGKGLQNSAYLYKEGKGTINVPVFRGCLSYGRTGRSAQTGGETVVVT